MDEAVLLVRQGDISEFYDLLNANFGGDVGGYMEAACRILHDVVGDTEVVMVVDDRLESIVELTRPRLCPKQFAERYPFTRTDPMQKYLEALRMHWHFKSQDEPSLFYSASCTYQALVERYLDGGDFAYKKTGQVLDLDFGGALELAPAFEQADEAAWVEIVKTWMKLGQNNLHKIAPVQISAMAQAMYQDATRSEHPRKEIFKMYSYQKRFKDWRGYLTVA